MLFSYLVYLFGFLQDMLIYSTLIATVTGEVAKLLLYYDLEMKNISLIDHNYALNCESS